MKSHAARQGEPMTIESKPKTHLERSVADAIEQSPSGQLSLSIDALRESESFKRDLALVKEIEQILTERDAKK
jgi:hypothetical protein